MDILNKILPNSSGGTNFAVDVKSVYMITPHVDPEFQASSVGDCGWLDQSTLQPRLVPRDSWRRRLDVNVVT